MGNFFEDLYEDVVPIVAGAAVSYFGGPQAGQATERSVDRLINGRPKPAPTVQNITEHVYVTNSGAPSSGRGITIVTPPSTVPVPGTGVAPSYGFHGETPRPTAGLTSNLPMFAIIALGAVAIVLIAGRK
jgi:hypothetical protein